MCVGKVKTETICPLKVEDLLRKPLVQEEELSLKKDILAISTDYTKLVLYTISSLIKKFQDSKYYRILFRTTQPAHLITALSVIVIAFLLIPKHNESSHSPLWTLVYLGAFSTHFGAQIWMTFISGLSLYFSIPRHMFGDVQQVLFPKYFLLNAVLSFITLVVFLKNNSVWTSNIIVQVASMVLCFMIELLIRLYFTPPLLTLISGKNEMEKKAGVGMEIGKLNPGELMNSPKYIKLHQSFRKVHMIIAIGNLISMGCTMLHLYYLSHKLSIII